MDSSDMTADSGQTADSGRTANSSDTAYRNTKPRVIYHPIINGLQKIALYETRTVSTV